jgi:selenocysteine lyase/cysteine desulfurase
MAIGTAVDFHQSIGTARKFARVHYLKNYWAERVKDMPGVRLHTSLKPEYAGGVALFSIDGMKPAEIDGPLMNQYKIHTVGIEWENIKGVRVTPHIYTSPKDLDRLVRAIEEISAKRKKS